MDPTPKTNGNLALQADWRREVSHRLRSYRERRGHSGIGDSQAALEFEHSENDARIDAANIEEEVAEYKSQSSANDRSAGTAVARASEVEPKINFDSHVDHEFDEATDAGRGA